MKLLIQCQFTASAVEVLLSMFFSCAEIVLDNNKEFNVNFPAPRLTKALRQYRL